MGDSVRKPSGFQKRLAALGLGWCCALGAATAGQAGEVEDALDAAQRDLMRGRCDAVERRVAAVEGLADRARLLAGQCEIRAGRYPEALERLDGVRGARSLTPTQVGDVELYRAIALYHLERYAEADAALASAEGLTKDEAQHALYRGLLALRDGDNERAAPALEKAARLAPDRTEPVASYYAGLAWQGAAERSRARDAFQRVIDVDGDGAWGREAQKLLESTELYPYYVRGRIGMEFDDNVLLRGDVTQTPADGNPLTIAGEDDWRGVWEIDGGVQLFQSDDAVWSGGVTASYAGNAHIDLADINLQYPTIGAYLANRLDTNTVAQLRYQFGHAWIDEDPYLRSHIAEASVAHTWTRAGTTTLLADFLASDLRFTPNEVPDGPAPGCAPTCPPGTPFSFSPPGVNERRERERDGIAYGAAIQHVYLVSVPEIIDRVFEEVAIGAGYRFRYFDSEGREWEHFSHILSATLEIELPLSFSLATLASYERRDFEYPSTFPDTEVQFTQYTLSPDDREEDAWFFVGELEKDLTENLSVSARYSYTDNDSNRDAYNYDRHIVGGYLKFRFD